MSAARWLATLGGIGYLPGAPGTWGALAALPLAYLLAWLGGWPALALGIVLASLLGWWATVLVTRGQSDHDPAEVVVDELAGQWIALLPVAIGAEISGAPLSALWPGWLAAFALFRLFDITKPGPVGWADRRGDAWGVMLDDLIAGALAALGVIALAALAHGVMAI